MSIFKDGKLSVTVEDGRVAMIPLHLYPRLLYATAPEQQDWRVLEDTDGRDIIFWEQLDELVPVIALDPLCSAANLRLAPIVGWLHAESLHNTPPYRSPLFTVHYLLFTPLSLSRCQRSTSAMRSPWLTISSARKPTRKSSTLITARMPALRKIGRCCVSVSR